MVVETLAEAHKTVRHILSIAVGLNNVACLIARQAVAPTGAKTGVPPVSVKSHFPFFFPPVQETSYQSLLIHLSLSSSLTLWTATSMNFTALFCVTVVFFTIWHKQLCQELQVVALLDDFPRFHPLHQKIAIYLCLSLSNRIVFQFLVFLAQFLNFAACLLTSFVVVSFCQLTSKLSCTCLFLLDPSSCCWIPSSFQNSISLKTSVSVQPAVANVCCFL